MELKDILAILNPLLTIAVFYMVSYLSTRVKLTERVSEAINETEKKYEGAQKASQDKLDYAIDILYGYVPAYLKPLITKALIENILQGMFDETKKFADMQLDRVADKINDKLDQ